MSHKRIISILFLNLVVLTMISTSILAQPPGGRGGSGDRPPIMGDTGDLPIGGNRDVEIPTDFSTIEIPTDMPATGELSGMMAEMELPFSLDDLELPGSSAEAYAGLVGFGQSYLGTTIDPLYASLLNTSGTSVSGSGTDSSMELPTELASITTELPVEVVAILTTADGIVYWGVYQPGAAAVYTLLDCSDNCTVTMENLEATLTDGSLGVYSVYSDAQVNDAESARSLIVNTYPALGNYAFEPYTIEVGYAFTGSNVSQGTDFNATGFLAGVVSTDSGQSLVYVLFGVGEGYAELLRP